ncbi:MAG: hypothetical protein ACYTFZ_10215 [Planctomycetota bacterium]|jgi:hypothetical protein
MAKSKELPGFDEKRKILFGAKSSPEKMRETGELFMDAERYDDALEFFQRCDAQDQTREIARRAMAAGNTPLYMRAKKVLGEDTAEPRWRDRARGGTPCRAERGGRSGGRIGVRPLREPHGALRTQNLVCHAAARRRPEPSGYLQC